MLKGTVKWFSNDKGYGFLSPEAGGKDIFVHFSAIEMKGFKTLAEGDKVEFDLEQGPNGQQACKVTKL